MRLTIFVLLLTTCKIAWFFWWIFETSKVLKLDSIKDNRKLSIVYSKSWPDLLDTIRTTGHDKNFLRSWCSLCIFSCYCLEILLRNLAFSGYSLQASLFKSLGTFLKCSFKSSLVTEKLHTQVCLRIQAIRLMGSKERSVSRGWSNFGMFHCRSKCGSWPESTNCTNRTNSTNRTNRTKSTKSTNTNRSTPNNVSVALLNLNEF